jgi:hypothetical protein
MHDSLKDIPIFVETLNEKRRLLKQELKSKVALASSGTSNLLAPGETLFRFSVQSSILGATTPENLAAHMSAADERDGKSDRIGKIKSRVMNKTSTRANGNGTVTGVRCRPRPLR